jgi:hypothetical protein
MKLRLLVFLLILTLTFPIEKVSAQSWLNWNWAEYSNWTLLSKTGDFTQPHWWWFRPEKRPISNAYVLLNHKPNSWVPTYSGCAFNPNGQTGKKYTVTRKGITFEYFLYENVTLVAPVAVNKGKVIAQTKGPRITGGLAVCGVRFYPPGVPVIVKLPF